MLLAVLDRHGGLFVLDQDVFINVVGGVRLSEPASDLAVLLALASSHQRRALPGNLVALAEVGLTGELRQVPRAEQRIAEAGRLGFTRVLVAAGPKGAAAKLPRPKGVEVIAAATVAEALERAFEAPVSKASSSARGG